jgi:hypothetical protein
MDDKQNELAARLLEVAGKAEWFMHHDAVLCALLGAALSFALRKNPGGQVVELLRKAADGIEVAEQPRTVN